MASFEDSSLLDIQYLLKEQNSLLQKILERQTDTDVLLRHPSPVPARSSSAWNPLLSSTLAKTEPIIARWQGGLDTLLIFVGFFSAIVASFLVESTKNLKADETFRTNEILANLTEIVLLATKNMGIDIPVSSPKVFVPDPADIRVNVYWSLALVLSICAAALAVVGRGFLALLIRPEGDAVVKLTEIYQRRTQAKKLLGPILEILPQVLLIPFVLFVMGLLDYLLSSSISLAGSGNPTLIASVLSCALVCCVGIALLWAMVHGVVYPDTSPFQTYLSRYLSRCKQCTDNKEVPDFIDDRDLPPACSEVFHLALQETFEDEYLDQASAALEDVLLKSRSMKRDADFAVSLTNLEVQTLLHLLSAEASPRSNLSAARTITHLRTTTTPGNQYALKLVLTPSQRTSLLLSLMRAADRHRANWPHLVDWHQNSLFIHAMGSLIPATKGLQNQHPLIILLSANYPSSHSIQLVEAFQAVAWFGVSSLTNPLVSYASRDRKVELYIETQRLFGRCTLEPWDAAQFMLSFMQFSPTTRGENHQHWADYETVCECISNWIADGEHATNSVMHIINRVLFDYSRPQSYEVDVSFRTYPRAVQTVMRLGLYVARFSSLESLMFSTRFILATQETFVWEVGRFITLRFIYNFISLLEKHLDDLQPGRRDWNSCRGALTYAYQWTLYRASGYGEYDIITFPEFEDTLPPREEFLSCIQDFWIKFQGSPDPPSPLPEWKIEPESLSLITECK